jgi:toxin HigB-1
MEGKWAGRWRKRHRSGPQGLLRGDWSCAVTVVVSGKGNGSYRGGCACRVIVRGGRSSRGSRRKTGGRRSANGQGRRNEICVLYRYICTAYSIHVIRSFHDKETEQVFGQIRSKRFPPEIQGRALVKMMMIDSAETVSDLTAPPSNRLEKLSGSRVGEYSIRINRQWRICFRFENGDAFDVGIEDYH